MVLKAGSAQRRRITSQYFSSSSIIRQARSVCSQAISVEPEHDVKERMGAALEGRPLD